MERTWTCVACLDCAYINPALQRHGGLVEQIKAGLKLALQDFLCLTSLQEACWQLKYQQRFLDLVVDELVMQHDCTNPLAHTSSSPGEAPSARFLFLA